MDREIVDPNHEDGDVDRKNAKHEDENGVGVVVEIIISFRSLDRRCQQADWRLSMKYSSLHCPVHCVTLARMLPAAQCMQQGKRIGRGLRWKQAIVIHWR